MLKESSIALAVVGQAVFWLPACANSRSVAGSRLTDLASVRVVDLTHAMDDGTIVWPTSPIKFRLERLHFGRTPQGFFYAASALCMPEHGGTHLDAPLHFSEKGLSVDQIQARQLIGPAIVVDVTRQTVEDVNYRLTVEDVRQWERSQGPVPKGAIVLLRTGWSAFYRDRNRYFGDKIAGDDSHLHFPSFGREAAELLVKQRRVVGIGVDTASLDSGQSTDFAVHRVVLESGAFGLENLTNLEQLPATGAWVIALPVKIAGGSGGPARVVALLDRH